jgi:hypothetical protein
VTVTAVDGGCVVVYAEVPVTVAKQRCGVGGPGQFEGPHDGAVQGPAPGGLYPCSLGCLLAAVRLPGWWRAQTMSNISCSQPRVHVICHIAVRLPGWRRAPQAPQGLERKGRQ